MEPGAPSTRPGRTSVKIGSFEFSLRELAGSFGDFGTLFPLAIGYIAVFGLDPAGLLIMMGVANIATGLVYRLPMPIQPMKVLAVVLLLRKNRYAPAAVVLVALGLLPLAATATVSVATNMAFGFAAGMAAHYLLRALIPGYGEKESASS